MIQHPDFDPVAVSLGPVAIHWYGIMYLIAFASAWWLGCRRAATGSAVLKPGQMEDLIFYGAVGVVLGGRMGYVLFYNFDQFLQSPLWLFKVWEGGMSFHGGFLGVVLAMLLFARRQGIHPGDLFDFVAPIVPIGLAAGRLGNFIGQELWGRVSDVPWAMVFPRDPSQLPRHPSQLYQMALEGLLLFAIVWWFSARPRPRWAVGGLFLAGYGVLRSCAEFFRQPDQHIGFDAFGWLTRGQILSLPMIVIGCAVVIWAYRSGQPVYAERARNPSQSAAKQSNKGKKSARRR